MLEEHQALLPGHVATLRVYLADSVKRAVVVKEDDILTKKELLEHSKVSAATVTELKTWLTNNCFKMCPLKDAQNLMTSRYVAKWKWVQINGNWIRVIRMRLCLEAL